jgi:hypothetical protein
MIALAAPLGWRHFGPQNHQFRKFAGPGEGTKLDAPLSPEIRFRFDIEDDTAAPGRHTSIT